jgi:hypothetical protein
MGKGHALLEDLVQLKKLQIHGHSVRVVETGRRFSLSSAFTIAIRARALDHDLLGSHEDPDGSCSVLRWIHCEMPYAVCRDDSKAF